MHPRRPSTTLLLVAVLLLAGLLGGCGEGGQSGNGSQDGGSGGTKKQGGEAARKGAPQAEKVALGTVKRVRPDRRKVFLKPSVEQQGKGVMPFKIAKKATITLDGEEAELADIKEGQQAQVGYIAKERVNRATAVQLFSTGEQPSGEGEGAG